MGVLVVTERIRGVAVCTTTQRRTQLVNAANNWSRQQGAGSPPETGLYPAGKYGAGPSAMLIVYFPDAATADSAWADLEAFSPAFLLAGSYVERYQAREDGETINETIVLHRYDWFTDGVRTGG